MRLRSIFKKSIRSMWRNKNSYISCIIVLSMGLTVFISMLSILWQIESGIHLYYKEAAFGDGFAAVTGMPKGRLKELKNIDGIAEADGYLSKAFKVNIGNSDEVIYIKLIGIDTQEALKVNKYTYKGNDLKSRNDIWLGRKFFYAHNLQIGDRIPLLINGREEIFTVQGIAESPEFITVISDTALMPDERTYTIGFVPFATLESYTASYGIITDLSFTLLDGIEYSDVEASVEKVLLKYGLTNLFERKDQKSDYYIKDDISQISIIGTILPMIFLAVSFIMLCIMLKRLIEQERCEIGTYKAFGFNNGEIISGYIFYGAIVGILAFLFAFILSGPFGSQLYKVYQDAYTLPDPNFIKSSSICIYSLLISLGVSIASCLFGASAVLTVRPAETMRSKAPSVSNSSIKFDGTLLNKIFNKTGIMSLRSIARNKGRSLLIVLSAAAAFALINVIMAFNDSVDFTVLKQPLYTDLYDIKFILNTPKPENELLNQISKIDNVVSTEGILTMPVQLINKNKKEDIAITGIGTNAHLYKIKNTEGIYIAPSKNGIILNTRIAKKLNAVENDIIEIKSPYLNENRKVIITAVFEEPLGAGCYMDLDMLSELFFEKNMVNNVLIKAEKGKINSLQEKLTQYPNVVDILNQERSIEVNKDFVSSFKIMIFFFVFMSFVMGFGAIYNVSKISLSEKQRELATMRILGYTIDETAAINSFEQWLMLFSGIVIGFIPDYFLRNYLDMVFSSDYFTLRSKLTLKSFIVAVLCCILAVFLSNLSAKKEIKNYNLAEVLKERE